MTSTNILNLDLQRTSANMCSKFATLHNQGIIFKSQLKQDMNKYVICIPHIQINGLLVNNLLSNGWSQRDNILLPLGWQKMSWIQKETKEFLPPQTELALFANGNLKNNIIKKKKGFICHFGLDYESVSINFNRGCRWKIMLSSMLQNADSL